MKKLIILFLCIASIGFSQTYSIDDYNLFMSGNNLDFDISVNTYYNSLKIVSALLTLNSPDFSI